MCGIHNTTRYNWTELIRVKKYFGIIILISDNVLADKHSCNGLVTLLVVILFIFLDQQPLLLYCKYKTVNIPWWFEIEVVSLLLRDFQSTLDIIILLQSQSIILLSLISSWNEPINVKVGSCFCRSCCLFWSNFDRCLPFWPTRMFSKSDKAQK